MNEVIERLNNYLSGYKSQYDYLDDNGLEHCLDDDIKQLLEIIKKLQQENQELKKIQCTFLGTGCQGKMKALKNQLEYLRSDEYLNQLKFERDMLQYIIDNGGVSKEDKTYIDCTHRNTELLAQQKEFIEYLENEKNRLAKECSHTYEDSLGKLLYVNEDIFNEVNKILSKYKEIIGGDNK